MDPTGRANVPSTAIGVGNLILNVGNVVALSDAALGTGGMIFATETVVATAGTVSLGAAASVLVGTGLAAYNLTSLAMDAVHGLTGYDPANLLSDLLLDDNDLSALINADAVLNPCP